MSSADSYGSTTSSSRGQPLHYGASDAPTHIATRNGLRHANELRHMHVCIYMRVRTHMYVHIYIRINMYICLPSNKRHAVATMARQSRHGPLRRFTLHRGIVRQ
jgi:hypothetical protein